MSAKVVCTKGRKCLLFHRWITVKDNGKTKYSQCQNCNTRKVEQTGSGYQPIDYDWVNYETAVIKQ